MPMPSLDVVGKNISWLHEDGTRYWGQVKKVYYTMHRHPKYPNSANRELRRKMKVERNDGHVFVISGEHEDLKRMKAMPDVVS